MKLATTLEELKGILTEDVWAANPSLPGQKCLVTAIADTHRTSIQHYLYKALNIDNYGIVMWNDKQTSVEAIHALIDKAIAIRDA